MRASELEKQGYVKIISEGRNTVVTFTEKARPYMYNLGNTNMGAFPRFILGVPEQVTVTEFVEPGIERSDKTTYAKFITDHKGTPVGEIIASGSANQDAEAQAVFVLRDGRWQLESIR
jgi:hypothetical protein